MIGLLSRARRDSPMGERLSLVTWSAEFILVLVAFAVLGLSLAFWLWFEALERVDLNRANAFTFLVPIFGLLVGAAFFGERLEAIQTVGVVLVLTGILLVQRDAGSAVRRWIPRIVIERDLLGGTPSEDVRWDWECRDSNHLS